MQNKLIKGIAIFAVSFLLVIMLTSKQIKAENVQSEWINYSYNATFSNGGTAWGQAGNQYLDGVFAYCTDIRTVAENGSWYNVATDGGKFSFDPAKRERLSLIAYYGYAGGGAVGSTDAYNLATKELIWRTVHDDMTSFSWVGIDVSYEKQMIEQAISNHYGTASFTGIWYTVNINEEFTITDTNFVINNATVNVLPAGVEIVSTVGNQVTLKVTSTNASGKIVEWKKNFPNYSSTTATPLFFEAPNGSQSLLRVGTADPVPFSIGINVMSGNIDITKTDLVTSKPLEGAEFKIEKIEDDGSKTVVSNSIISNADGKVVLNNLALGNYQVKEVKSPTGYFLDDEPKNISITQNGEVATLDFKNTGYGSIELTKSDRNITDKVLEGAEFKLESFNSITKKWEELKVSKNQLNNKVLVNPTLKDISVVGESEKLVTDIDGKININYLVYGKYRLTEIKAPTGYLLTKEDVPIEFEISGTSPNVNKIKVEAQNTLYSTLKIYKVDTDSNAPLPGAEFKIYDTNKKEYQTIVSDATGYATLDKLPYGTYQVCEIKSPDNHIIDNTCRNISVYEAGAVIEITWPNKLVSTSMFVNPVIFSTVILPLLYLIKRKVKKEM